MNSKQSSKPLIEYEKVTTIEQLRDIAQNGCRAICTELDLGAIFRSRRAK